MLREIINPPKSTSTELYREVIALKLYMDASKKYPDVLEFAIKTDEDWLGPFIDFMNRTGVSMTTDQVTLFNRKMDDLFRIVHAYKEKFAIDRPYILAKGFGIEFDRPYIATTTDNPSYPSGHAAISRFIALYMDDCFDLSEEERQALFHLAVCVAHGRMTLGVHTRQDIDGGCYLADAFFEDFTKERITP